MTEEENSQQGEAKGGNKMMLFIILGAVLFLIIIGIVVIMLMSGGHEEEEAEEGAKKQPAKQEKSLKRNPNLSSESAVFLNPGPIFPIVGQPFLINLAGQGRTAFLQVSVSLVLSDAKLQAEVERKLDIIKATIIEVLSTKSPEELNTTKGKNRALNELKDRFNEYLMDGEVSAVLFTNYIIQVG
ncbi:flagellar basal body-associated FliL family protein [Helicobacter sp. T3_23-1056]